MIGLYTINITLGSYTELTKIDIANLVNLKPVNTVRNHNKITICSEIMYVKIDKENQTIQHQNFTQQEFDLMIEYAKKIGAKNFEKFIERSLVIDKVSFMKEVNYNLKQANLLAGNYGSRYDK